MIAARRKVLFAILLTVLIGVTSGAWDGRFKVVELSKALANQTRLLDSLQTRLETADTGFVSRQVDPNQIWHAGSMEELLSAVQGTLFSSLQDHSLELERYRQLAVLETQLLVKIPVEIEMKGDLVDVITFLTDAHTASPPFAVDLLSIRPLSEREQLGGTTQVLTQLLLWTYADKDVDDE